MTPPVDTSLLATLEGELLIAETDRDVARKRWLDAGTDDMALNISLVREYHEAVGVVTGILRSINSVMGGQRS